MATKFKDQTAHEAEIPEMPQRIISLVPSQTELLHDLGLAERVVGITKFCVHPEAWWRTKTRVGGTKILRHAVIDGLQPDLIIANKEENTLEDVQLLRQRYPVWVSDVCNLTDALAMIRGVGEITGTFPFADDMANAINQRFTALNVPKSYRTLYLIWRKPYMAVGQNTFVDDMLQRCGFTNVIVDARYPEVSADEIRALDPELVLLSSEPYPFREQHVEQMRKIVPHAKIQLVNGEPFSWYGSRLLHSAAYFERLHEVIAN